MRVSAGVPTVAGCYNACISIFGSLKQTPGSWTIYSNAEVEMVIREGLGRSRPAFKGEGILNP
jgi:hypothetical protein